MIWPVKCTVRRLLEKTYGDEEMIVISMSQAMNRMLCQVALVKKRDMSNECLHPASIIATW